MFKARTLENGRCSRYMLLAPMRSCQACKICPEDILADSWGMLCMFCCVAIFDTSSIRIYNSHWHSESSDGWHNVVTRSSTSRAAESAHI